MDISSGTPLYVGNGNGAMGGDWGIMFLAFLFETQKQISDQTLKFSEMMNAQNMMIVAENQKTRDLFMQDRFERMQAEINELKRQRDLAGLRDSLRPLPPPFPMAAGF